MVLYSTSTPHEASTQNHHTGHLPQRKATDVNESNSNYTTESYFSIVRSNVSGQTYKGPITNTDTFLNIPTLLQQINDVSSTLTTTSPYYSQPISRTINLASPQQAPISTSSPSDILRQQHQPHLNKATQSVSATPLDLSSQQAPSFTPSPSDILGQQHQFHPNSAPQSPHSLLASSTNSQPSLFSTSTTLSNRTHGPAWSSTSRILPLPDWPHALHQWGHVWGVYVWGFAILFLSLSIVCTAIYFRFKARARRLRILSNILVLVGVAAGIRFILLLTEAFGRDEDGNSMTSLIVIGLLTQGAYPLLCASFGLTQVNLQRLTNVAAGPGNGSKLRSVSWLLGCTLGHIFLVVLVETLVAYRHSLRFLLLLDSGAFIVWALYLCVTFICAGFRLTEYASETRRAKKELDAFSNYYRRTTMDRSSNANTMMCNERENAECHMHTTQQQSMHMQPSSSFTCNANVDEINCDIDADKLSISNNSNKSSRHKTKADVYVARKSLTSDQNIAASNVRPTSLNLETKVNCKRKPAHPEPGEIIVSPGSPLHPSLLSTIQSPPSAGSLNGGISHQKSKSLHPRLSRPRLRMTDDGRMMVTIATEDEDQSTSSTDADETSTLSPLSPENYGSASKRRSKQKQKRKKKQKKSATSILKEQNAAKQKNDNEHLNHPTKHICNPLLSRSESESDISATIVKNSQMLSPQKSFNELETHLKPSPSFSLKSTSSKVSYKYSPVPQACDGQHSQILLTEKDIHYGDTDGVKLSIPPCIDSSASGFKFLGVSEDSTNEKIKTIKQDKKHIDGTNDTRFPEKQIRTIDFTNSLFTNTLSKDDVNNVGAIFHGEMSSVQNITQNEDTALKENCGSSHDAFDTVSEPGINSFLDTFSSHQTLTYCSSLRDNGYLADTENQTIATTSLQRTSPNLSDSNFCLKLSNFLRRNKDKHDSFLKKGNRHSLGYKRGTSPCNSYLDDNKEEEDSFESSDSWTNDELRSPNTPSITTISTAHAQLTQSTITPSLPSSELSILRHETDTLATPSSTSATFLQPAASSRTSGCLAPLGLFRIRQGGLVQRTVTLTYILTFLYLFACLLQLYTSFGVYGVLSSSKVPAPWPWLVFHSAFRAIEFSIGAVTVIIVFFTLRQRTRRRHHNHHRHYLHQQKKQRQQQLQQQQQQQQQQ